MPPTLAVRHDFLTYFFRPGATAPTRPTALYLGLFTATPDEAAGTAGTEVTGGAYARQVIANAQALTKGLEAEGLRAVTGGTDTHLALLDVSEAGVTGAEAESRCDAAAIVLNKNAIPYDPQPPSVASGIRVGSPAVTTLGMGPVEMDRIAALIGRAIRDTTGAEAVGIAAEVGELVSAHPAYPEPRA